jgi:hypothetical protein
MNLGKQYMSNHSERVFVHLTVNTQVNIPIKNGGFWLGKSPILMGDFGAWPQGAQCQVEGCGGEAQRFPHLSAHPMDAEFKW